MILLSHLQPSVRRIMSALESVLPESESGPFGLDVIVDALVDCRDVQDVMGDAEILRAAFQRALGG